MIPGERPSPRMKLVPSQRVDRVCILVLLANSLVTVRGDGCQGKRVYMHPLPAEFNHKLLYNRTRDGPPTGIFKFMDIAKSNNGFGQPIGSVAGLVDLEGTWFNTDQYALEKIFYHRMLGYTCLVGSFWEADLVYVPYFGAHDALREMGRSEERRDWRAKKLVKRLRRHPAWQRRHGRDHFFVLGSPVWDFFRTNDPGWGSGFLLFDGIQDNAMTVVVERGYAPGRVFSSPPPTGFHPQTQAQLKKWQAFVLSQPRQHLFSLASGHRNIELQQGLLREKLFWQCHEAGPTTCGLLDCDRPGTNCHSMDSFSGLYLSTQFCLNPVGDSCQRRAVIDAILAGCIPVVFKDCTLKMQFQWHLEEEKANPSQPYVYIPWGAVKGMRAQPAFAGTPSELGDFAPDSVMVEDILRQIPEGEIMDTRRRLVALIPKLIYGGRPNGLATNGPNDFTDAFDVIIDGLSREVSK